MRVALGVEYDGSAYSGWERQRDRPTVQAVVEQAISRVADHEVRVVCAGRTDAGVHAMGQVVHFDTDSRRPLRAWTMGVNTSMPEQVAVWWAAPVSDAFHARFSAIRRHYHYVIYNHPLRPALWGRRVAWEYRPLDVDRMRAGARHLVGTHDFTSYRAAACQAASPVRTVERLALERRGAFVHMEVTANAFLHHMVRNLAGVLMDIGAGKHPPEWAEEVLVARDRSAGGVTAPPQGLVLDGVDYPPEMEIPGVCRQRGLW